MKKSAILALALILLTVPLFVSAEDANVSKGKTYQLITEASTGYPDSAALKLTNGVYAAPAETENGKTYYASEEYVGFNQSAVDESGYFVAVIDLGAVTTGLSSFELSYLNETDVGIFAPSSVTFAIADTRNGDYTVIGSQPIDEPTAAGNTNAGKASVEPDGPVSGQFVMVSIRHKGTFLDENGETKTAGWTFIDEITVYGAGEPAESSDIPSETTPEGPQTGDGTSVLAYALLGITSAALLALVVRRRMTEDKRESL